MDGALGFELVVEGDTGDPIGGRGIAQFLIERCLIIKTGGEAETEVAFPVRYKRQVRPRRGKDLVIKCPVVESRSDIKDHFSLISVPRVGVLYIRLEASRLHSRSALKGIEKRQPFLGKRQTILRRVAHAPFGDDIGYEFGLGADTPRKIIILMRPLTAMCQGDDTGLEAVASVLVV